MAQNDHLERFLLAADDPYWIYKAQDEAELGKLITNPHWWVCHNAKSTLPDHFVVLMQSVNDVPNVEYLIQGIDGTSVITVRTFDKRFTRSFDPNPLKSKMGLILYTHPNDPSGEKIPMRAYTHLELTKAGDKKATAYLAEFLLAAWDGTDSFLRSYSDSSGSQVPKEVKIDGTPSTKNYKVNFVKSANPLLVFYESHGTTVIAPCQKKQATPLPPAACSSDSGTALIQSGDTIVVTVDTIIVKAYA